MLDPFDQVLIEVVIGRLAKNILLPMEIFEEETQAIRKYLVTLRDFCSYKVWVSWLLPTNKGLVANLMSWVEGHTYKKLSLPSH